MLATAYKSSPPRLVRLFRRSRDTWKQRAAAKQATIKKLRITVRDLTASRDHWKALAQQPPRQRATLEPSVSDTRPPACWGEA